MRSGYRGWNFSTIAPALAPFILLLIMFEIVPLSFMVIDSLHSEATPGFTFASYYSVIANRFYRLGMRNSLLISLYSSLVGLGAGLLGAYAITRFPARMRDFLLSISNMTSNFAGIPLAFAYIILLGNNGLLTLFLHNKGWPIMRGFDLYSWSGLALVYAYFQIPLALLLLYPGYNALRSEWQEAAELLGANPAVFWFRVGLPVMMPGILGTFSLLFANSMGAYATAYALVGSNYQLLTVQITSLVAGNVLSDPHQGSALGVILGLLVLLFIWINNSLFARWRREMSG